MATKKTKQISSVPALTPTLPSTATNKRLTAVLLGVFFFFSSRRRHTSWNCDWSSDVCSSDLKAFHEIVHQRFLRRWRELLGKQGFRAIHGQRCSQGLQFHARGALRGLNLRLSRDANLFRIVFRQCPDTFAFRGGFLLCRCLERRDLLLEIRQFGFCLANLP